MRRAVFRSWANFHGHRCKASLSWLSQLFSKTMDARLRATMAEATSAEEAAAVQGMTREEIVRAKIWEQRRLAAQHYRGTRDEWRHDLLAQIDWERALAEKIHDQDVRVAVNRKLDSAIAELAHISLLPVIEHMPTLTPEERDPLPVRIHDSRDMSER